MASGPVVYGDDEVDRAFERAFDAIIAGGPDQSASDRVMWALDALGGLLSPSPTNIFVTKTFSASRSELERIAISLFFPGAELPAATWALLCRRFTQARAALKGAPGRYQSHALGWRCAEEAETALHFVPFDLNDAAKTVWALGDPSSTHRFIEAQLADMRKRIGTIIEVESRHDHRGRVT